MAQLLIYLKLKLNKMKNTLKTTLLAVAALSVLTVSAQKPRPAVAPKSTEKSKTAVGNKAPEKTTVPTKKVKKRDAADDGILNISAQKPRPAVAPKSTEKSNTAVGNKAPEKTTVPTKKVVQKRNRVTVGTDGTKSFR